MASWPDGAPCCRPDAGPTSDSRDWHRQQRAHGSAPIYSSDWQSAAVRPKLFGVWEGNWVAYNTAHDVALPNSRQKDKLGFFMYPQAETAEGRLDSLDPDNFKYTITARAINA